MKKIIFYFMVLSLTAVATSCKYGFDDTYNALPDIEIGNVAETGVVPSQLFLGEVLKISPQITYGSEPAAEFGFRWYKQYSNSLKLISEDPVLNYALDSLGVWTIRLEVTNKVTQVTAASTVSFTVISRSERGWYILKETSSGNTDMDLVRMTQEGEVDGNEYNLLAKTGNELAGKPVGLSFVYNYNWKEPGTSYFTSYISTIMPISQKGLATFRMRDEWVLESNKKMFFDDNDGNNNSLTGGITSPIQSLIVNNHKAHLMVQGMQAFLPVIPGAYSLSPYFTITDGTNPYMLGFDEQSHSFVFITARAASLSTFPDAYLPENYKISSNNMNGTLSFMENTDGSLNPDTLYQQRAYALFHETTRTDRCILLGLDLAQIDPLQSEFGATKYSPIMYADTISYARVPALKTATLFAMHKNYPLLYFAQGNKVSSYLIDSKIVNDGILAYPTDEEVTYLHFYECLYDTNFRNLLVATYNATAGTYKIYRYVVAGNDITEVGSAFTGSGRVKTLIYASPNYSYWNNNVYRNY